MMPLLNAHKIAEVLAGRMLNGLLDGIALAFLAFIVMSFLGREKARTRFFIWFAVLAAVAAFCIGGSWSGGEAWASPIAHEHVVTLSGSWAIGLMGAWLAIALIGLARVALGLWRVRLLRARSRALELTTLDPVLQQTIANAQASRGIVICLSDEVAMPTAIGFFKPAVILPPWIIERVSTADLNAVLVHELAHLEGWDDCTNLAQKILRALLFFHPSVWWLDSRLALEREMACDEVVISRVSSPKAYAACLVSLAEKSMFHRGLALAQALAGRMRQTSLRVARLMTAHPARPRRTLWALALGSLCLIFVGFLGALPGVVAFEDADNRPIFADNSVPLAGVHPIPAAYQVGEGALQPRLVGRHAETKPHRTRTASRNVAASKLAQRNTEHPGALQAKFEPTTQAASRDSSREIGAVEQAAPTSEFLVVMESQYYASGDGLGFWRVRIVQYTVFHPKPTQVEPGTRSKST